MNVYTQFTTIVRSTVDQLARDGIVPQGLDLSRVAVEPPRDPAHGDLATNAAMVLAKPAKRKPRDLAEHIVERLRLVDAVVDVSIAGPGFINMRLEPGFWRERLRDVLSAGVRYGDSTIGNSDPVNVEYVSANPTGPLHAAHARGAVVGDVLANLLAKAGYTVTREYYINDAGTQVDILARSTYLRYCEALGDGPAEIPSGYYPGEYLKDVGRALVDRDGDRWRAVPEEAWLEPIRSFAIERILAGIKTDLQALGIGAQVFSSERALAAAGAVDKAIGDLEDQGLLYVGVLEPPKGKKPDDWEPRPQTLFRSTDFGDDVDRPIKKSDGTWTYFATDIAYHRDKVDRGARTLIDVWGADHSGYIKRMTAAVRAITGGKGELDVKVCQLVHLLNNGQPVKMSKRAGTFITLADLIEAVGKDVVRFMMLTRRNDQTLEFDYAKVTEQSKENPVFYVQYAHARCRSVLRHAHDAGLDRSGDIALDRLEDPDELALIRQLAGWPRLVEGAAQSHEPHRIVFYLQELAAQFHALWNKGRDDATLRFLIMDDLALSVARLAMIEAVATVIASGLAIVGVEPAEEM